MALPYDSGVATDQTDLLEKLESFCCTDNDWTQSEAMSACSDSTYGAGEVGAGGKQLHLERVDQYGETNYIHLYACYRAKAHEANYGGPAQMRHDTNTFLGITTRHFQGWGIAITASRGFTVAGSRSAWNDHPTPMTTVDISGGPQRDGAYLGHCYGQSLPYFFFAQGDSIHVVVEVFPNEFQHMSFGTLIKSGEYVGGQYFSASNTQWAASDYWKAADTGTDNNMDFQLQACPFGDQLDGFTTWYTSVNCGYYIEFEGRGWMSTYSPSVYPSTQNAGTMMAQLPRYNMNANHYNNVVQRHPYANLFHCCPSSLTSLSPHFPMWVHKMREDNGEYSVVGYIEGLRVLNMKALAPKTESTLGPDTWKAFFGGNHDVENSMYATFGQPGIAYLMS